MGYSESYTLNMTRVHNILRTEPATPVQIVTGRDALCEKFPQDEPCHCHDANVAERDGAVLYLLKLSAGDVMSWKEITGRIAQSVVPQDIDTLCVTCPWRAYGVCQEGIAALKAGQNLLPLPRAAQH